MTAGRKPKKVDVVDVIDPSLDQTKITGAMVQMRVDGVASKQSHEAAIFDPWPPSRGYPNGAG
ncbi:hypothetical protein [Candidatus Aalborgicola defluviihabitans]|uniref:hypothetical protein n=1 Tax=Candidatus Aalborgicola defluviihabitans TaxID=3386187 RepID=UPI001DCCEE60|nr:hypothetical protein [Burkholderiales bacterium]